MANIRRIRDRIRGVKNIQQITRAMKMVSSARLHKAQSQLLAARPYAFKLKEMIRDIAGRTSVVQHPLLQVHPVNTSGLLVLASDKGLCAGFNSQTLQWAGKQLLGLEGSAGIDVLAAGRKAVDFFRRTGIKPLKEWAGFWNELSWLHADAIGDEIIAAYTSGRWNQVTIVYNRFKSMFFQELTHEILLPIPKPTATPEHDRFLEFDFEPSADEIMNLLLPRYVKNAIWHALLESKAAELAARMQAMENATKSAGEMIGDLKLTMNRARQAAITNEISELVSSAEAINA